MNQSKIHVRYAKALFSFSLEKGVLDEVKKDMDLLISLFSENENFFGLSNNPAIKGEKKRKIFSELFEERIHPVSFSFMELLLENKREEFIPGIARHYIDLYKREKNIKAVTLTSAEKLDDESVRLILVNLQDILCCEVEFDLKTDENLIGGFQLIIDDLLVDASVQGELRKIKNKLLSTGIKVKE